MEHGALIERGEIVGITDDGYIIRSITREGIELKKIQTITDATYTKGELVYFFAFSDGKGSIISAIT